MILDWSTMLNLRYLALVSLKKHVVQVVISIFDWCFVGHVFDVLIGELTIDF